MPARGLIGILLCSTLSLAPGCERQGAVRPVAAAPAATPVRTVEAWTGEVEIAVRPVGQFRAVQTVTIAPEVAGFIETLHFDEGAEVRTGDLLVQLDDRRARAEFASAQAVRNRATRQVQRFEQAATAAGATPVELDTVRTELEQAEALYQLARVRLENHRILAPFDGRVGLREVYRGGFVQPGDSITTLTALDPIDVEFWVPEQHLASLRPGLSVSARTTAFDRDFVATTTVVSPTVDPSTRAVRVIARAENREGLLRPGMSATVRMVLGMRASAVLIPESAVQFQGSQAFVYVVGPAGNGNGGVAENGEEQARVRRIQIAERMSGTVEVAAGLRAGERIVVEGLQRLRDGARVEATPLDRPVAAAAGPRRGGGAANQQAREGE